jgi:hypothetical protein
MMWAGPDSDHTNLVHKKPRPSTRNERSCLWRLAAIASQHQPTLDIAEAPGLIEVQETNLAGERRAW